MRENPTGKNQPWAYGGALLPRNPTLPSVPLEQTTISATVVGPVVDVTVTQRFRNSHHAPLDALYLFPLPEKSAIREFELQVGDRVIQGEVLEREQARERFAAVAAAGGDAALLNQERPNIFTVEVANLQPNELVHIRLHFADHVPFDDGAFRLTLPTVVMPRYIPPTHDPADAARIGATPLLPAEVPGHTLAVVIELDTGPLVALTSPSHEIVVSEKFGRYTVTLPEGRHIPNRDLVLCYHMKGERFTAAAFTYRAVDEPGTVLLLLAPQGVVAAEAIVPRELLFVFDRSGSMGGNSIVQARRALRASLRALNPSDTFNIFPFDDTVEQFAPTAQPFTQEQIDAADDFIERIEARGGTEILPAIQTALRTPRDPNRLRILVFLTDGGVSNEEQVLRDLSAQLNEARVFAFGVGSSVNRYLLDKLAAVGRGTVEYVLPGEAIEPAVQRFQGRVGRPLLHDISVTWEGAKLTDMLPAALPDLYAKQPLVLLARFHTTRDTKATAHIRGKTAQGEFAANIDLELPLATPDRSGAWAQLPTLWARAKIEQLMDEARLYDGERHKRIADEVRELALRHKLMSNYTAFVATADPPPDAEGRRAQTKIIVPLHLPAGTLREAFEAAAPPPQLFAAAPPPPSPRPMMMHRLSDESQAPGAGLLSKAGSLLRRIGGAASRDQSLSTTPSPQPSRAAARSINDAGSNYPPPPPFTPAQMRDAALFALAAHQRVNGSWGDQWATTVLVLAAFAPLGQTPTSGDRINELLRAEQWLNAHTPPNATRDSNTLMSNMIPLVESDYPALAVALRSTDATAIRDALAPLQQRGGDANGLIMLKQTNPRKPDALALGLTAVLMLVC